MNNTVTNIATSLGDYSGVPAPLSSLPVTTTLVSGLTLTKTADKQVWADGELTYTLEINNTTAITYVKPVVTDILDITKVVLDENSIKINGTTATPSQYHYDAATGTLTFNLADVTAGAKTDIEFKVEKK